VYNATKEAFDIAGISVGVGLAIPMGNRLRWLKTGKRGWDCGIISPERVAVILAQGHIVCIAWCFQQMPSLHIFCDALENMFFWCV
jgi:hypothetical protein